MFSAGASRVVAGTALLNEPEFARAICAHHGPDRIVAAVDVRDGQAVGDGWLPGTTGPAVDDAVEMLLRAGFTQFAVTAIDRDGLLEGPDLDLLTRIVAKANGTVIASGGIRSGADLVAVRKAGCSGAIVGRAIYEGRLSVAAALAAVADPPIPATVPDVPAPAGAGVPKDEPARD